MSLSTKPGEKTTIRIDTPAAPAASTLERWGRFFLLVIVVVWAAGLVVGFETSLTILVVLGLMAAVTGVRYPALGLLGIGMLATLDAVMRNYLLSGGLLRWNTLNYWLLMVMALNIPFLLRLNNVSVRLLQIFVLLLTLELVISPDQSQGMQDVLNIVTTFGMLVYFAKAWQEENAFYWLALVAGTVSALGGAIYFLQVDSLTYMNPNAWAFFPLTGLLTVCLGYAFKGSFPRNRLLLLVLAAVNGIWIFFSGSRGTILTGAIAFLYLFLASRNLTWKAIMLFVVAVAGIWFSARFVEQSSFTLSRLNKTFNQEYTLTQRTSSRSDIAKAGFEVFQRNPLGIGTGGFEEEVDRLRDVIEQGRPAHSAWIKVLAENGFLGFILLFLFLISFTISGWRHRSEGVFLIGLLVTLAIGVSFISKEYQGKGLWLLAVGGITMIYSADIQKAMTGAAQAVQTVYRARSLRTERRDDDPRRG